MQFLESKKEMFMDIFRTHTIFPEQFLNFEYLQSGNEFEMIPFRYLFAMHFSEEMVFHYIRQFVLIMYILRLHFGIYHYSLTLDNLAIRKTEYNEIYMFHVNKDKQYWIHCPFGYHIYIHGFEECLMRNQAHPLFFKQIPNVWNSFIPIFQEIKQKLYPKKKTCRKLISNLNSEKCHLPLQDKLTEYPFLLLLINHSQYNPKDIKQTLETIQSELHKMFFIFHKEFEIFKGKFKQMNHFHKLMLDWVNYMIIYKKDFYENPEVTLNILRKVFYQYMIDHSYNHITFKSFDLTRMIVGLYTWSDWYEKWLCLHQTQLFKDAKDELILLGCIELFFEQDYYHNDVLSSMMWETDCTITRIRFDGKRQKRPIEIESSDLQDLLRPVHPMLRPSVLSKELWPKSQ